MKAKSIFRLTALCLLMPAVTICPDLQYTELRRNYGTDNN